MRLLCQPFGGAARLQAKDIRLVKSDIESTDAPAILAGKHDPYFSPRWLNAWHPACTWLVGSGRPIDARIAEGDLLSMTSGARGTTTHGSSGRAKNVILMIGDGMGAAHRFAGQLLAAGRNGRLAMDRLPHLGQMHTLSIDRETFVTDSAAAATAIATGMKTINGSVSMSVDGTPQPTMLEILAQSGRSTGLVTTCQLTDATPAAFAAHVPHRSDQSEIARQFVQDSRVDVLLGGGGAYWYPLGEPNPFSDPEPLRAMSRGTAGRLAEDAVDRGYRLATTASGLQEAIASGDPRIVGLFAGQELFVQSAEGLGDVYDPAVSLAEMTSSAIDVLSRRPEGFFLMVEESAIDRMAHRNNAPLTLKGVLELDRAVQVAVEFAADRDDTLVIVTADHETGGLAIAGSGDTPYPYEPGGGLLDTMLAHEDGPFPVADEPYGFVIGWATTGHTAATVPVSAMGPGAEAISGTIENTDLFPIVLEAAGVHVRTGS